MRSRMAQGSVEYLIIIATVAAIASVAIIIASSSFSSNKESGQFTLCKAAASSCKTALLINSSAQCSECDTACIDSSTSNAISQSAVGCCKLGQFDNIYSSFTETCTAELLPKPFLLATKQRSIFPADGVYGPFSFRIWNAINGTMHKDFQTTTSVLVNSVAWSPDGLVVASGSWDKSISLWDARTGGLILTLSTGNIVRSVAWSPDGMKLASGSDENVVRIWNAPNASLIRTLSGHSNWVMAVAWSPDGTKFASGSADQSVKIWDANSWALIRTLSGTGDIVHSVAWSPDGTKIAAGSMSGFGGSIKIWDLQTGNLLVTIYDGYGNTQSTGVVWSPDNSMVAAGVYVGSGDMSIKIWSASTGTLLRTLPDGEMVDDVAWNPDGTRIASCNNGGSTIWNASDGTVLKVLPFPNSYSGECFVEWGQQTALPY